MMRRSSLVVLTALVVASLAQTAYAYDPRPLHPTIREKLGPVRVVLALPEKPLVYDPLLVNSSGAIGAAAGNAAYGAQTAPAGAGGSAAAGGLIGVVLAGYTLNRMHAEVQEDAVPMLALATRLLEEREVRQRIASTVNQAMTEVEWVGAAPATVDRAQDDAAVLKALPADAGAVLVVRFFALLSKDGRQVNLFARANLYHPQLGPEFTLYKRKGKRTPVPWTEEDAALAATGQYRWSTPGWTVLVPKSDADRAEEVAAIDAWFAKASEGVRKITREKLVIERKKRLHAAENNMQSAEMARARAMAAWEADGGAALAAQVDAAVAKLLPKLIEDLKRLPEADEEATRLISH